MDKKDIESIIRKAFNCTSSIESIPETEYDELNYKIARYDVQTVKKYLPLLLIRDSLKRSEYDFDGTGDQLVYFLDGNLETEKGTNRYDDIESHEVGKEISNRIFKDFNHDEINAIILWLEEIALSKYKDLCHDDVRSAINFWKNKLKDSPA